MRTCVAFIVVLALAACGDPEPEEQGAGASQAEVTAELEEAIELTPGQYETRVEILDISMPGMPAGSAEQMREMMAGQQAAPASFCLTPEEAGQGAGHMVQELTKADCEFDSLDVAGANITADMRCSGAAGIEGHYLIEGEMTPDSSVMTMQMDQTLPGVAGGGQMQMEMRVTSQRTGDCA